MFGAGLPTSENLFRPLVGNIRLLDGKIESFPIDRKFKISTFLFLSITVDFQWSKSSRQKV